ncbi:MAG TPA: protein translocase subunit SecD [Actinobacteria bacterium]|nr:protein translocase subunit SecD [Actinomycetota bacterium]
MSRRRLLVTLLVTLAIAWGSVATLLALGRGPRLGLDLQGGFAVVLVAPEGTDRATLDKAVEIMRRRIEGLGAVQEPEISIQGDRAILVQLPGVEDRERALQAVGTTGEITFRPVLGIFPDSPAELDPEGTHPPGLDPETGLTVDPEPDEEAYLPSEEGLVYHVGPAFLTGRDLEGGEARFSPSGGFGGAGGWVVVPEFTEEGGEKFRKATGELATYPVGDPRRRLAIVVDGVVTSAPAVAAGVDPAEGLDPDAVVITIGDAENPEAAAEDLAAILRYGALPTTFERERVESVSASLGADSLRAGIVAGLAGLVLVAVYLVAYYRILGLVAIVGLSVFGSLVVTLITLLGLSQGLTLTLAGVTGVIVSVGITSDSYIVYFERIKEEHRAGRPLRAAVDHAFSGAFRTILTGDTVTFLGAILLWFLAIGPVKSFALTLGLATAVDVAVAYFYTRPAVALVARSGLREGGGFSLAAGSGATVPAATDVEVPA